MSHAILPLRRRCGAPLVGVGRGSKAAARVDKIKRGFAQSHLPAAGFQCSLPVGGGDDEANHRRLETGDSGHAHMRDFGLLQSL